MTRVTSSDQVLLALREQLQLLGKGRTGRPTATSVGARREAAPMARVRSLAGQGELGEEEFGRTLVRALLAEQLSEQVAQDPAFQAVLDDVYRIVSQDVDGRLLLARAAEQLKSQP